MSNLRRWWWLVIVGAGLAFISLSAQSGMPPGFDRDALVQRVASDLQNMKEPELRAELEAVREGLSTGQASDAVLLRRYRDAWGDYHWRAAEHWKEKAEYGSALDHVERGLEAAPWHLRLRTTAALIHEALKRPTDVAKVLKGGLPFARPGDEPYVRLTLDFLKERQAERDLLVLTLGLLRQFEGASPAFRQELAQVHIQMQVRFAHWKEATMMLETFALSNTPFGVVTGASIMEGQGHPDKAERLLSEALNRSPDEVIFHERLIDLLLDQKQYRDALAAVRAYHEAYPQHIEPVLRNIEVLLASGQRSAAEKEAQRAIQVASTLQHHERLALVCSRAGHVKLVQRAITHAEALDLDLESLRLLEIDAMLAAGQPDAAQQAMLDLEAGRQRATPVLTANLRLRRTIAHGLAGEPALARRQLAYLDFPHLSNRAVSWAAETLAEAEAWQTRDALLSRYLEYFPEDRFIQALRGD